MKSEMIDKWVARILWPFEIPALILYGVCCAFFFVVFTALNYLEDK